MKLWFSLSISQNRNVVLYAEIKKICKDQFSIIHLCVLLRWKEPWTCLRRLGDAPQESEFLAIKKTQWLLKQCNRHFKGWWLCFSRKNVNQLQLHLLLKSLQRAEEFERDSHCVRTCEQIDMPCQNIGQQSCWIKDRKRLWNEVKNKRMEGGHISLRPKQGRRAAVGAGLRAYQQFFSHTPEPSGLWNDT